jgi:hypothetical protein
VQHLADVLVRVDVFACVLRIAQLVNAFSYPA